MNTTSISPSKETLQRDAKQARMSIMFLFLRSAIIAIPTRNDAPERRSSDASESESDNPEPDKHVDSDRKKIPKFSVTWHLPAAIADVQDMETFMLEALTLTRAESSVKLMSCQDYIHEEYGPLGLVLLENIFSALNSPGNGYEDSTMEIYAGNTVFSVSLSEKLSYLKGMLLWLCLSIVRPRDESVCISTAAMTKNSIILMPLQPIETTDQLMSEEYWHEMFEAAVIVQDPRLEPQPCMSLEMDFKMMVRLSGVSWKVLHDNGFLLRGPFTQLTPIRELENEHIMWHFEILRPGDQFEPPRKWMRTLLMYQLRLKKALVSWFPPGPVNQNMALRGVYIVDDVRDIGLTRKSLDMLEWLRERRVERHHGVVNSGASSSF